MAGSALHSVGGGGGLGAVGLPPIPMRLGCVARRQPAQQPRHLAIPSPARDQQEFAMTLGRHLAKLGSSVALRALEPHLRPSSRDRVVQTPTNLAADDLKSHEHALRNISGEVGYK